jgi:uncharacterized protein (TIGR04255 family)
MSDTECHHEDYLNVYIRLPEIVSRIGAYSLQAQIPFLDIGCMGTLNSASTNSPVPGFSSFVIDIDIGTVIDVPQKDTDIVHLLQRIRIAKNEFFEASITDAARATFHEKRQLL